MLDEMPLTAKQHKDLIEALQTTGPFKVLSQILRAIVSEPDAMLEAWKMAVMRNQVDVVKSLLVQNPDLVNCEIGWEGTVFRGGSSLHYAASVGNYPLAKLFLSRNRFLINVPDLVAGCTPLHYAARSGCAPLVALLLAQKEPRVRLTAVSHLEKRTVLHEAAIGGHAEVLAQLLPRMSAPSLGANDAHGKSALDYAVMDGHAQATALLLLATLATKETLDPWLLCRALENNYEDVADVLLPRTLLDYDNSTMRRTALHIAASNSSRALGERVFQRQSKATFTFLPLEAAVLAGNVPMIEFLQAKYPIADVLAIFVDKGARDWEEHFLALVQEQANQELLAMLPPCLVALMWDLF